MSRQHPRVGTVRRGLYVALGAGCVALGAVGIVVPGLPTTVFLLLAAYLFARSSPKLHRRLVEHPLLGAYLKMARERAMPLRAKMVSLAAMWGGVVASYLLLAGAGAALQAAAVVMGVVGTAVLLGWVRTLPDAAASSIRSR